MRFSISALLVAFTFETTTAQEAAPQRQSDLPVIAHGALLGPDGLNTMPFGTYRAKNSMDTRSGPRRSEAFVGIAHTMTAMGSRVFGPANADVSALLSIRKENFLKSDVEGEVNSLYLVNEQGRKGDAANVLGTVTKVKSGNKGDTGGALGYEFRSAFVSPSGEVLNDVHSYGPYMAPRNDMSGGAGYGSYVESFVGANFAAYTAGAHLPSDPTTGWRNVIVATRDRTIAGAYFRVRGSNSLSDQQRPGDIVIGLQPSKTIRNNQGFLQIRNAADSATLLEVSEAGALGLPSDPEWAAYIPTLACGAGRIANASATGAFKSLGKTAHVRLKINVSSLGDCSGQLIASLPAEAKADQVFAGSSLKSGRMLQGIAEEGRAHVRILDYAGSFPLALQDQIIINGTYEIR